MEKVMYMYMFAAFGMFVTFFTVLDFIVKKVRKYTANELRNKEKDYLNGYDYLDKKDFMENYNFCNTCKSYWNAEDYHQCMCYAR